MSAAAAKSARPAIVIFLEGSQSKGTTRLVGASVFSFGSPAWPSLEKIALRAGGVSERTVRRQLVALERLGELAVVYKAGPAGTNRYTLTIADPDTHMSGSPDHPDIHMSGSRREAAVAPGQLGWRPGHIAVLPGQIEPDLDTLVSPEGQLEGQLEDQLEGHRVSPEKSAEELLGDTVVALGLDPAVAGDVLAALQELGTNDALTAACCLAELVGLSDPVTAAHQAVEYVRRVNSGESMTTAWRAVRKAAA